jgi:formylglycine-generating enzyme required for sulfatase activity
MFDNFTRKCGRPIYKPYTIGLVLFAFFLWYGLPYALHADPDIPLKYTSAMDRSEMVLIPHGPFIYGMNRSDMVTLVNGLNEKIALFYNSEHKKVQKVLEKDYFIDKFEVTNEKYARFMKATGHQQPKYWKYPQFNSDLQPVVGVGWSDAEAYCKWANKRLPTEEEWEKAARGTNGHIWPWGNNADNARYNGHKKGFYAPINVGSFPAGDSPYGVSDMAGNVWEMTSSSFTEGGNAKTMKGGSYLNTSGAVRTVVRWGPADEQTGSNWLGFRCVMDITAFSAEK